MAYYISLTKIYKKPVAQSNKETTGIVIMSFLNLSFFVFIVGTVYLFTIEAEHYQWLSNDENLCGPFANNTSFSTAIEEAIRSKKTFLTSLYKVFMQWPTTILNLLLIAWIITQSRTLEALQERFLNDKISDLQNEEATLTNLIFRK